MEYGNFVEFLKHRDAWEKFLVNIKNEAIKGTKHKTGLEAFRDTAPYMVIQSAFDWVGSPEGIGYWVDIDYKWKEFCDGSE